MRPVRAASAKDPIEVCDCATSPLYNVPAPSSLVSPCFSFPELLDEMKPGDCERGRDGKPLDKPLQSIRDGHEIFTRPGLVLYSSVFLLYCIDFVYIELAGSLLRCKTWRYTVNSFRGTKPQRPASTVTGNVVAALASACLRLLLAVRLYMTFSKTESYLLIARSRLLHTSLWRIPQWLLKCS